MREISYIPTYKKLTVDGQVGRKTLIWPWLCAVHTVGILNPKFIECSLMFLFEVRLYSHRRQIFETEFGIAAVMKALNKLRATSP